MWIGMKQWAVVVGVKQQQMLPAIGVVLGVVDVEHQPARRSREAIAEQRDHCRRAAQLLKARHGRLGTQISAALG